MNIDAVSDHYDDRLEKHRPAATDWQCVISGFWEETMWNSGEVNYTLAKASPGIWILNRSHLKRTEDENGDEDIDAVDPRIVAVATEVEDGMEVQEIAQSLYDAACESSGYAVSEWTGIDPLIEP